MAEADLGRRAAKIDVMTAAWFRNTFAIKAADGWSCVDDTATAEAKGNVPALYLMDGVQSDQKGVIHRGVVSVPPDQFALLHRCIAGSPGIDLKAHEVKTDIYRAFFDLDVKVPVCTRPLRMIAAVIRRWNLGRGLETTDLMNRHLKVPPFAPIREHGDSLERVERTAALMDRLWELHPIPVDRDPKVWYWDEVLDALLDPAFQTEEAPKGMGRYIAPEVLLEEVLRPIYVLFVHGLALEARDAVRTLYPKLGEHALDLRVTILGNYGKTSQQPIVALKQTDHFELRNFGCHLVCNVVVDDLRMLHLRDVLVDQLATRYADVPVGEDGARAFFGEVCDANPYRKRGGKRLLFSHKCSDCPLCTSKRKRMGAKCALCLNTRRINDNRYVGPINALACTGKIRVGATHAPHHPIPDGLAPALTDDTNFLDIFFGMRESAMKMSTVSMPSSAGLTPGAAIEGRPPPAGVARLARDTIAASVGEAKAKREIAALAKDHGADGQHDRRLIEPLAALAWYYEALASASRGDKAMGRLTKQLLAADDPRRAAIVANLPAILADVFGFAPYGGLRVQGVTALTSKVGVERLWVNVTGGGAGGGAGCDSARGCEASFCYGRCVDTLDTRYRDLLPAKVRANPGKYADVATLPGRHRQRTNAIWFELRRDGEYGTITQRCFSGTAKTNRRAARVSGGAAKCEPTTIRMDDRYVEVMRSFFFLPSEADTVREDVLARARHLERKRKADLDLGPTSNYGDLVTKTVQAVKQRKARKRSLDAPFTAAEVGFAEPRAAAGPRAAEWTFE